MGLGRTLQRGRPAPRLSVQLHSTDGAVTRDQLDKIVKGNAGHAKKFGLCLTAAEEPLNDLSKFNAVCITEGSFGWLCEGF